MTASLVIRKDNFEEHYDILEEIGSGQFATVKKCVEKSSNSEFAAKIMKKKRRSSRRGVTAEQLCQEANILLKARHPGVIYLHEVFENNAEFTLVLELLSGGELFEFLVEQEFLTENEAIGFTKQVVDAVDYLHDCHIVHLDIKFALVSSLSMGTFRRCLHRAFSINSSVLERNRHISRIVLPGNATSELDQLRRRRKRHEKKSKRFNKQNKNPERATHFLCGYHMTYFVKLDGNAMRVSL